MGFLDHSKSFAMIKLLAIWPNSQFRSTFDRLSRRRKNCLKMYFKPLYAHMSFDHTPKYGYGYGFRTCHGKSGLTRILYVSVPCFQIQHEYFKFTYRVFKFIPYTLRFRTAIWNITLTPYRFRTCYLFVLVLRGVSLLINNNHTYMLKKFRRIFAI